MIEVRAHRSLRISARTILLAAVVLSACGIPDAAADPALAVIAPSSVLDLADKAKAAFRERVEPPPVTIPMLLLGERERTHAQRAYLLRSYDAAIDALVVEAIRPGQRTVIERQFRKMAYEGHSSDADRIFADIAQREAARGPDGARAAAAAQRHAAALGELPTALHVFVGGGMGRTLRSLGDLALPAYRTITELEPDDPWNWIVLGWLTAPPANEEHFVKALSLPATQGDPAAAIEALQQAARIEQGKGHPAQAEALFKRATAIAQERAGRPQATRADARSLSIAANAQGDFYSSVNDADAARTLYQAALQVREARVRDEPASVEAKVDVIVSHDRLARLPADPARTGPPIGHLGVAVSLYEALNRQDRFRPMIALSNWPAMAILATFIGAVLTSIIGVLLMVLYRRRVARLMMASAAASVVSAIDARPPERARSQSAGRVRWRVARAPWAADAAGRSAKAHVIATMRRAAWVEIAGACAFALGMNVLYLRTVDLDVAPLRFAVLFTAWIWPVVFVLALLWAGDRKRIALALGVYFGVLLGETLVAAATASPLELFGVTVPAVFQVPIFWSSSVLHTAVLLLFLNRRIRAIGPVLLPFMLVIVIGGIAMNVFVSTYAGRTWFVALFSALHLPFDLFGHAIYLAGMIVAAPVGWLLLLGIRRLYRARWISDQGLVFDSIWLYHCIALVILELRHGPWGWAGLGLFLIYKAVVIVGLRIAAGAEHERPPLRVLLLRVFGFQRRTERFFDVMAARWRHAGPIQMISAPDLAAKTIDPDELMDFVSGRLRRRFIMSPADLARRLAEADERRDASGLYLVNEYFCGKDAWRATVQALMTRSEWVVMDLRGFAANNLGCIFELQALLDAVPAGRIVLLIDRTTDEALLRTTLTRCAVSMAASSPNRAAESRGAILVAGARDIDAVDTLLELVGEPHDAKAAAALTPIAARA